MSSPLLKNLEAPTTQELHAETPDLICVISPTYWKLLVFFFWPQVVIVVLKSRLTLCDPIDCCCQASLSFTISLSLLKLMSIESVMLSNHLISCRLLLFCLQSFPASGSFPKSPLFASGGQSIASQLMRSDYHK